MHFEAHSLYHIYNQGNNRQQIFFQERNYLFFLSKMRKMLTPYGSFIAYCLMPNHFHWLFYTNPRAVMRLGQIQVDDSGMRPVRGMQLLARATGSLLSSYTRAVNNQEGRSGSLFRAGTKAKNGWLAATPTGIRLVGRAFSAGNDYALRCFDYIHQNPVQAGLTNIPEKWPYSSAPQYATREKNGMCDLELAIKVLEIPEHTA